MKNYIYRLSDAPKNRPRRACFIVRVKYLSTQTPIIELKRKGAGGGEGPLPFFFSRRFNFETSCINKRVGKSIKKKYYVSHVRTTYGDIRRADEHVEHFLGVSPLQPPSPPRVTFTLRRVQITRTIFR